MSADLATEFIHLIKTLVSSDRPNGQKELAQDQLYTRIKTLGHEVLVDRLGRPNYALIGNLETQYHILFDLISIDQVGCLNRIRLNTIKGSILFLFDPLTEKT